MRAGSCADFPACGAYPSFIRFSSTFTPKRPWKARAAAGAPADYRAVNVETKADGVSFDLQSEQSNGKITLSQTHSYNSTSGGWTTYKQSFSVTVYDNNKLISEEGMSTSYFTRVK